MEQMISFFSKLKKNILNITLIITNHTKQANCRHKIKEKDILDNIILKVWIMKKSLYFYQKLTYPYFF